MQNKDFFWKPVNNYPAYMVSKHGSVICNNGNEIAKQINHKGYYRVGISNELGRKSVFIHRIVATAFLPNPNNLPQVNHKDGNKKNNHYLNLEWCDNSHNIRHAIDNGLMKMPFGENHPNTSLTEKEVLEIRQASLNKYFKRRDLAEIYGVTESNVKDIRNGRSWKHLL